MSPGRRIVLATRNPHKVFELRRILGDAGLDAELVGVDSYPDVPEVPETGDTFEENALLKARAVSRATGELAVADDSGLCVEALRGMPGVLSARWSGDLGDGYDRDTLNLRLVLAQVRDVPDERRGAWFECAAVAVFPTGDELVAHRRASPWDDKPRRPSHADKRRAWRRDLLAEDIEAVLRIGADTAQIRELAERLLDLAA